jgi:hypothetical protein
MKTSIPDPGSAEAIAKGCTCLPQCGFGATTTSDGRRSYICDWRCPLHGIELFRSTRHHNEPTPSPEPAEGGKEPIEQ